MIFRSLKARGESPMVFAQGTVNLPDNQQLSDFERFLFHRQTELILELVAPQAGERMLDIGCGKGDYLRLFKEKWCSVTGLDSSAEVLKIARNNLAEKADLVWGQAEDLPFSDDEFDIVTLITFLEASRNAHQVIREAIRVCRGRVFIAFLNNFSCAGTKQKLKELFGFSLARDIHFYRLAEIKKMVGRVIGTPDITWGSVIYFPEFVYSFFEELEEALPLKNNPFGAFTGLVFPVKYTYRTVQNPIMNTFVVNGNARQTAPGAASDMLRGIPK